MSEKSPPSAAWVTDTDTIRVSREDKDALKRLAARETGLRLRAVTMREMFHELIVMGQQRHANHESSERPTHDNHHTP